MSFWVTVSCHFLQLARLPRERQEQIATVASVGPGLEHSHVSTSRGMVETTSTTEAKDTNKGTATSTAKAKDTNKGTATSTAKATDQVGQV